MTALHIRVVLWNVSLLYIKDQLQIKNELFSYFSVIEDLYVSNFSKAGNPGLSNMNVAGFYRPPITPLANFAQFILITLE